MNIVVEICLFAYLCIGSYKYFKLEKDYKEAKKEIERLKMKAIRKDSL